MHRLLNGLAVLALAGCGHDDLPVATNVDLGQFEGKWYEIAHLPRPTQRDCTGTIATYTRRSDGTFSFVHECTLTNGAYFGSTATAAVKDARVPAKLAVDFGGYVGDYWILEVAPDYRYAVVGHPSRDYLWVLSRTPAIAESDKAAVLEHAKENGFDTSALEYTAPAPLAQGTPAPPVRYGCAAAPGPAALGGAWALALAALFVLRRRRASRGTMFLVAAATTAACYSGTSVNGEGTVGPRATSDAGQGDAGAPSDGGGSGGGGAAACTSGTTWLGGDRGSSSMHPGMACIDCHASTGGPSFTIGGTVFPSAHDPDDCNGASGISVVVTDANGATTTLSTNSAGNFYTRSNLTPPFQVQVESGANTRAMSSPAPSGDCNSCHTQEGANGAPGRILAP